MKTAIPVFLFLMVCVSLLPFLAGRGREGRETVDVIGSTSIQPFAELLADEFNRRKMGSIVEVQGGGSTAGIQALANGLADIGMCSRVLKKEEERSFKPVVIARDGLAVVVNGGNPVPALSMDQLRRIFRGEVENWSDVGGPDLPVRPITREEGSGTRETFMTLVMGKDRISRRALVQESNGAVKELVKGDPAAVGYMSMGLVGSEIRAVPVDGVKPAPENIDSGKYRLCRRFFFVVKEGTSPGATRFLEFILSKEGQDLLRGEGLMGAE
jgi:phosphate transport system substrate-binding protein